MSRKIQKCNQLINSKLTGFLISMFLLMPTLAQNLSQMESEYKKSDRLYQREQTKLDSLNKLLIRQAAEIDQEKNRSEADINRITDMMAYTITISNQVRTQQELLTSLEENLEELKQLMDLKYATLIDSLRNIEKLEESSDGKENIETLIFEYIQKRLIVAPKIYTLSFDPEKIVKIDLTSSEDTLEYAIYQEYLQNALSEVDGQIVQLNNIQNEIQQIIYLQQKANDFMEDINSDIQFGAIARSQEKVASDEAALAGDQFLSDYRSTKVSTQVQSYGYLLRQLKSYPDSKVQSTWQTPLDSIPTNLTFQQYQDLLKEIERRLQEYRFILTHKLDNIQ